MQNGKLGSKEVLIFDQILIIVDWATNGWLGSIYDQILIPNGGWLTACKMVDWAQNIIKFQFSMKYGWLGLKKPVWF